MVRVPPVSAVGRITIVAAARGTALAVELVNVGRVVRADDLVAVAAVLPVGTGDAAAASAVAAGARDEALGIWVACAHAGLDAMTDGFGLSDGCGLRLRVGETSYSMEEEGGGEGGEEFKLHDGGCVAWNSSLRKLVELGRMVVEYGDVHSDIYTPSPSAKYGSGTVNIRRRRCTMQHRDEYEKRKFQCFGPFHELCLAIAGRSLCKRTYHEADHAENCPGGQVSRVCSTRTF